MTIEDARKFVDEYVKRLPLPVQLNGITEEEKQEAASMCDHFASEAVRADRKQIARDLFFLLGGKSGVSDKMRAYIDFLENGESK